MESETATKAIENRSEVSRLFRNLDDALYKIEDGRRLMKFVAHRSARRAGVYRLDELGALFPREKGDQAVCDSVTEIGRKLFDIGGDRLLERAFSHAAKHIERDAADKVEILDLLWHGVGAWRPRGVAT